MLALTHSRGSEASPTQTTPLVRGIGSQRILAPFSLMSKSQTRDLQYRDGPSRQTTRAFPEDALRRETLRRSTSSLDGAVAEVSLAIQVSLS